MPPAMITRKKGDSGPTVRFQVLLDSKPANLIGASVFFQAKFPNGTSLKVNKQCTPVNAEIGIYDYTPDATDFDTQGNLRYEVRVVLSNGQEYTSPSSGTGQLAISDDLE